MPLSRKVKEAIKTALAMTIAYAIALQMGWDKPLWAGFAVAFISLSTIGQSLGKGVMRMLGTLMAAIVALTIIALFSQDRWLFMVFLSAWIGFCCYMMGGQKNQYFWHVGGFACGIIAMAAVSDPGSAFSVAILRTQETGLGILVYSLISVFLWPSSSRAAFEDTYSKLTAVQLQLFQAYCQRMRKQEGAGGTVEEIQALHMQEIQLQTGFKQLLAAAEIDDYEIWEQRRQWKNYQLHSENLSKTLEYWQESYSDIEQLDIPHYLANLDALLTDINQRLTQVNRMVSGHSPAQMPQAVALSPVPEALDTLTHFQKAAFTVFVSHVQSLDSLSNAMFTAISDIRGYAITAETPPDKSGTAEFLFLPDLDRLFATIRIIVSMWIAYLALIYIDALPGGASIVSIIIPMGMALANAPQLPVSKLYAPVIGSILVASLLYIFLMPQLSTFYALGLLLFTVTFCICYVFSAPRQIFSKLFGLAIFLSIASISNEQSYNFLVIANTALTFLVIFVILAVTANIPFSSRPEHAFLRLLSRFFRCSDYLLATMRQDQRTPNKRRRSWKAAWYRRELSNLPHKIEAWGRNIDSDVLSGTQPEQVRDLATNLLALTYRIQNLLELCNANHVDYAVQELGEDILNWQTMLQETFKHLSENPTASNRDIYLSRLSEIIDRLENHIKETVNATSENQPGDQDGESFYRLLGALRSLSEGLVNYAQCTKVINWSRWRDERF